MIITVGQLRLIHYYYFAMGVFGAVSAFFVGLDSLFSLLFLGFFLVNSAVSWYMAFVSNRRMRDYLILESGRFLAEHTIVIAIVVAFASIAWTQLPIGDLVMLRTVMLANYFVLFIAGMWYGATKTDFVKGLFTIYDSYLFRKSKEFILKVKAAHRSHFGREIASDNEIRDYRYGSNSEVDSNLVSAWKNRSKKQYVLECLGRIELALARDALKFLRDEIRGLMVYEDSERKKMAGKAALELKRKERDIMEFEKAFYSRASGELPA